MSSYHELYLRPLTATADPVRDLETILGVGFDCVPIHGFVAHAVIGRTAVEVDGDLRLDDDLGMPFASHPWQVSIRNFDRDAAVERAEACRLFLSLRDTGRYSLFLTFDAQRLIASAVVPADRQG